MKKAFQILKVFGLLVSLPVTLFISSKKQAYKNIKKTLLAANLL